MWKSLYPGTATLDMHIMCVYACGYIYSSISNIYIEYNIMENQISPRNIGQSIYMREAIPSIIFHDACMITIYTGSSG